MKRLAWTAPLLLLVAGFARAQDIDKEKLKQEILEEVDKIIEREQSKMLKSIDQFLREEFAKLKGENEPAAKEKKGRGYLGIRPSELTPDELEEMGLKEGEGAVRIAEVLPDTPAAKSGLVIDDVILEVDGENVVDIPTLVELIQKRGPGDDVEFTVLRGEERKKITVTLMRHPDDVVEEEGDDQQPSAKKPEGNEKLREKIEKFVEKERKARGEEKAEKKPEEEAPPSEPGMDEMLEQALQELRRRMEDMGMDEQTIKQMLERAKERLKDMFGGGGPEAPPEEKKAEKPEKEEAPAGKPYIGILIEELADEDAEKAGLEAGEGLAVVEVREDSPAAKAGFKSGDILVELDGETVRGEATLADFMRNAKPDLKVECVVLRDGERVKLEVTLGRRG